MDEPIDHDRSHQVAFDEYLAVARAKRNSLALVSLGLLTALGVWAYSSYSTIRTNFSREQMLEQAQGVGQRLMETAQPRLIATAKELVPVYRTEAERAIEDVLPQLQASAQAELELIKQHAAEKAEAALRAATLVPLEHALQELKTQFPALQDEEFVDALVADAQSTLEFELEATLDDTQMLYRPALERLTNAMLALRDEELAAASDEELMQRFMHLWLLLIDTELMGRAPCSLDALSMLSSGDVRQGG